VADLTLSEMAARLGLAKCGSDWFAADRLRLFPHTNGWCVATLSKFYTTEHAAMEALYRATFPEPETSGAFSAAAYAANWDATGTGIHPNAPSLTLDDPDLIIKATTFDGSYLFIAEGTGIRNLEPDTLTINGTDGTPLAVIDLTTGHATLTGDVNEVARLFWEAVEFTCPRGKDRAALESLVKALDTGDGPALVAALSHARSIL